MAEVQSSVRAHIRRRVVEELIQAAPEYLSTQQLLARIDEAETSGVLAQICCDLRRTGRLENGPKVQGLNGVPANTWGLSTNEWLRQDGHLRVTAADETGAEDDAGMPANAKAKAAAGMPAKAEAVTTAKAAWAATERAEQDLAAIGLPVAPVVEVPECAPDPLRCGPDEGSGQASLDHCNHRGILGGSDLAHQAVVTERDSLDVQLSLLKQDYVNLLGDLASLKLERDRLQAERDAALLKAEPARSDREAQPVTGGRGHCDGHCHHQTQARHTAPFDLPAVPDNWFGELRLRLLDDNTGIRLNVSSDGGGAYCQLKAKTTVDAGDADFLPGLISGLIRLMDHLFPHLIHVTTRPELDEARATTTPALAAAQADF